MVLVGQRKIQPLHFDVSPDVVLITLIIQDQLL